MKEKAQPSSEPAWLWTLRKTAFTDAELDALADDFIARMADTQAWQGLVAKVYRAGGKPPTTRIYICRHRGGQG